MYCMWSFSYILIDTVITNSTDDIFCQPLIGLQWAPLSMQPSFVVCRSSYILFRNHHFSQCVQCTLLQYIACIQYACHIVRCTAHIVTSGGFCIHACLNSRNKHSDGDTTRFVTRSFNIMLWHSSFIFVVADWMTVMIVYLQQTLFSINIPVT